MLTYNRDGWRFIIFYFNQSYIHSCFTLSENRGEDVVSTQLTVDFFPHMNTCAGFLFLKTLRKSFTVDSKNIKIADYMQLESVIKKYNLDCLRPDIEEAKYHVHWPWRRIEAS